MTDAQINRALAEKIMGWRCQSVGNDFGETERFAWFDKYTRNMGDVVDWQPIKDANQVLQALEAARVQGWEASIRMSGEDEWLCALYNYRLPQHLSGKAWKDTSFIRAVCLALLETTK